MALATDFSFSPLAQAEALGLVGSNGKINKKFIQSGITSFGVIAANAVAEVTLTFPTAFNNTPLIVVTPNDLAFKGVAIIGRTKTNAKFRVYNDYGGGVSLFLNWIAIDQEHLFTGGA
jgi:hypothetical protein